MQLVTSNPAPSGIAAAPEQSTRIDLAAAHRIAEQFGWTQLIYNHFTCRVPGADIAALSELVASTAL